MTKLEQDWNIDLEISTKLEQLEWNVSWTIDDSKKNVDALHITEELSLEYFLLHSSENSVFLKWQTPLTTIKEQLELLQTTWKKIIFVIDSCSKRIILQTLLVNEYWLLIN